MDIKTAQTLHKSITGWLAHHSLLLNASIAFNVEIEAWIYHFDNPLTCTPEDRLIGDTVDEKEIQKRIEIEEVKLIKSVIKSLESEYDSSDDLTDTQKAGLEFVDIDYMKVCDAK